MIKLCAFADEATNELYGQIEALIRNNIKYLELRNVNGTNVKNITEEQAIEYARVFKEKGITIYSIGSPVGKVDINVDFDEYLKEVEHVFRLAKIFETKKIRMFSFYNAINDREKVISYLNKLTLLAKEYGVELYHENEKDIYGEKVNEVIDILDNVPLLKSVYDPANYLQAGEDSNKTLDLMHNRTDYFHIKDVIVETGELVPAGYGDGNILELINRIKDDKVLSLEPHLAIFEGYNEIDGTEMKNKFYYKSNGEAFDAAVKALKDLLKKAGYEEREDGFVKI